MVRFNIFLEKVDVKFLKKLSGKVSEHVRIAIREYIERLKELNVSASASKKLSNNK